VDCAQVHRSEAQRIAGSNDAILQSDNCRAQAFIDACEAPTPPNGKIGVTVVDEISIAIAKDDNFKGVVEDGDGCTAEFANEFGSGFETRLPP
jgi:hypothetical protein